MLQKIRIPQSQLIISHGEYGFQEVLDDFNNTNEVTIVTYNISAKCNKLLNLIRNLNPSVKVTMVTNIPRRYKNYIITPTYDARIYARKNINSYLLKMDKKNFNVNFAPYFNFHNHIKIVMTDNIAYVGSQNFSDKSSDNLEMGILIKDKNTIIKIRDIVSKLIISNSTAFGGTELDTYICNIYILLEDLQNERNVVEQITSNINDYEESGNGFDSDIAYGDIFEEDFDNIKAIVENSQLIQQELKGKELYKSVDFELTELENIPVSEHSDLIKYANYNELEQTKEFYNHLPLSIKGSEIENYMNNRSLEGLYLLTDKDIFTLNLLDEMVSNKKLLLYKSCFMDFKDLNISLEVLNSDLETILDNLQTIKDNQNCIDNTK